MSKKDDMSIISLLARSKKRINVLKSLEKEDKIPSKISKDINDNSNHVSKYLKTLKEADLVECLNEEDKRYRFYNHQSIHSPTHLLELAFSKGSYEISNESPCNTYGN